MKANITPTQEERTLQADDFIVSKTDTRGVITYGNPIFIEFSGYNEAELIGVQHNIIRHPDMPRSVFRFLWETIRAGEEFFGYVKNMGKSGYFYWVFAHITPDFDAAGKIVGYTSVRRCPSRQAINTLIPLYQAMLDAERQAGAKQAMDAGFAVLQNVLQSKGKSYAELVHLL